MILVLADGAGSARAGGLGAQTVVAAALRCADSASAHDRTIAARSALEALAESKNQPLRDFATTFLVASLTRNRTNVSVETSQIGDGVIVAGGAGDVVPLTLPDRGEHANETTFLTSDAWQHRLSEGSRDIPFGHGVMLMSDGPMSVLYDLRSQTVAPACGQMLDWGARHTASHFTDALARSLEDVIAPETSDDCSIACAVGVLK